MRGVRAVLCACALGGLVAAELSLPGAARPGATATCGRLLPPRSGSYLGAFTDFNTPRLYSEDHVTAARIDAFERTAGRQLALVYFSQGWYRGLAFPRERVLTIWLSGAVPYIAFLPHSAPFYGPGPRQRNPEQRFSLQKIIDGRFDEALRAWSLGARDLSIPIVVSFGAEVNDDWGPWNARWNGAGQKDGYGDPAYPDGAERYRDAYRHVVDVVRGQGATNVTWVFHVDSYRQHDSWNELRWYYPGDEYVDWIGISDYGSLDRRGPITPFAARLASSRVYEEMAGLSGRPMAIVEMGAVDDPAHGKATWIGRAFAALRSGRYPRIRAAVWWNMDTGADTRIDSSPAALAAFRAGTAGSFFAARPRFAGACPPLPG